MAGSKDSAPVAVRRTDGTGKTIISWFPNSEIAKSWVEAYNADNTTGFAEIVIEDVDVMTSINIINNIPEKVNYFVQMCRDKIPQRFRKEPEDEPPTWGIDMDELARREKTSPAVGCLTNKERAYLLQYRYFLALRSGCVVDPLMKKENTSDIQVTHDVGSH